MDVRPDGRVGGMALLVGYLAVVGLLFREPSQGIEMATASVRSGLYFLALPAAGILAGAYGVLGGPYRNAALFAGANYLGVFGLTLAVGAGIGAGGGVRLLGGGLFVLAVVALIASVRALVGFLGD